MRTLFTAVAASLAALALPTASIAQQAPAGEDETPAPSSAREANLQAAPSPPTTQFEPGTAPDKPDRLVTTYPGNVKPPPAAALDKQYPVCRGAVQDNCQNAGEGGAPGRSRALGYWPGEPASERSGG